MNTIHWPARRCTHGCMGDCQQGRAATEPEGWAGNAGDERVPQVRPALIDRMPGWAAAIVAVGAVIAAMLIVHVGTEPEPEPAPATAGRVTT